MPDPVNPFQCDAISRRQAFPRPALQRLRHISRAAQKEDLAQDDAR